MPGFGTQIGSGAFLPPQRTRSGQLGNPLLDASSVTAFNPVAGRNSGGIGPRFGTGGNPGGMGQVGTIVRPSSTPLAATVPTFPTAGPTGAGRLALLARMRMSTRGANQGG